MSYLCNKECTTLYTPLIVSVFSWLELSLLNQDKGLNNVIVIRERFKRTPCLIFLFLLILPSDAFPNIFNIIIVPCNIYSRFIPPIGSCIRI